MESKTINVLDKGFVELQDVMGNDLAVVQAARVSTLKESKGYESDKALIHYLMSHGHTSPFEQVELKFRIKCPLICARQILRHRTANVNEVSRRYSSEQIDFWMPEFFRKQAESNKQSSLEDEKIEFIFDGFCDADPDNYKGIPVKDFVESFVKDCLYRYDLCIQNGVAREQARIFLPTNLYTMFIFKIDLHNLLHFLDVRSSEHAQWETRQFALAMMKFTEEIAPLSYEAWEMYRKG